MKIKARPSNGTNDWGLKRMEEKRLNEAVYEKVLERFWMDRSGSLMDREESCFVLLARCPQSFEGTMWEVRTRLEAELGTAVGTVLDPREKQAAYLLFGLTWSQAQSLALLVKQALAAISPEEFLLMLAEAGERPERNPLIFERMTELFGRVPDMPEIAIFTERESRLERLLQ